MNTANISSGSGAEANDGVVEGEVLERTEGIGEKGKEAQTKSAGKKLNVVVEVPVSKGHRKSKRGETSKEVGRAEGQKERCENHSYSWSPYELTCYQKCGREGKEVK